MKERKPVICIRKFVDNSKSNFVNSNINAGQISTFPITLSIFMSTLIHLGSRRVQRACTVCHNILSNRHITKHFELEWISRLPDKHWNRITESNSTSILLVHQVKSISKPLIVRLPVNVTVISLSFTRKNTPKCPRIISGAGKFNKTWSWIRV